MGNRTKEDELYREMCRVVGKVVLEMRDLGQLSDDIFIHRMNFHLSSH